MTTLAWIAISLTRSSQCDKNSCSINIKRRPSIFLLEAKILLSQQPAHKFMASNTLSRVEPTANDQDPTLDNFTQDNNAMPSNTVPRSRPTPNDQAQAPSNSTRNNIAVPPDIVTQVRPAANNGNAAPGRSIQNSTAATIDMRPRSYKLLINYLSNQPLLYGAQPSWIFYRTESTQSVNSECHFRHHRTQHTLLCIPQRCPTRNQNGQGTQQSASCFPFCHREFGVGA